MRYEHFKNEFFVTVTFNLNQNPKWDENPCASKKHVVCKKPTTHGGTV